MLAAVVTNLLTLGGGRALLVGATFGLAKAYAVLGLLWLGTIGLPTSLGVAGVAAVWGRIPLFSGMAGFCVVAALAGFTLQLLVFILAWHGLWSWERANDWQGFVPPHDMPRTKNPPEGFFATANEDLNRYGRSRPINMPMGPYRADRIRELLAARDNFAVEDMRAMHFDVCSRQADFFMKILRPLLPPIPSRGA